MWASCCTILHNTVPVPAVIMHTYVYVYVIADIDDLFEVQCDLLDVAHKWKGLGKALRLRPSVLNRIEADRPDVNSRLEEVLTEWLQQAYNTDRFGLPSWNLLVAAVAHPAGGNDHALARRIAEKHNGTVTYCIQ